MKPDQKNYLLKVYDMSSGKTSEHNLIVERSLHSKNGNVIWNTKFDFNNEIIEGQNQYRLPETINDIRKIIEPKGFRILVKCSDLDAAQSGMLADMSSGTLIYKLNETSQDNRPKSYDILEESNIASVATLVR